MKKIILFPLYFLIVACFFQADSANSISFMSISDGECVECSIMLRYNELDNFINAIRGVNNVEYYLSDDDRTLILTIEYNHRMINIKTIKRAAKSKGFKASKLY